MHKTSRENYTKMSPQAKCIEYIVLELLVATGVNQR